VKADDIAPEPIAGDSASLHRLIRDLEEPRDLHYAVRPVEVNSRLGEALFADGALLPRREIESQIFAAAPTSEKVVRFLPRDRLLSQAEKAIAKECFAHVVQTGEFTSGPRIEAFEAAFADFVAVPHVVATGS
jgi:3-dehydro-glucose-6-phosphate--glutamate transaminase